MADPDLLSRARCLHPAPERVLDQRFGEADEFFDPHDLVQVKYELLRACHVDQDDVAAACRRFGFSRQTYYTVQAAFLEGGLAGLVGRPRGRPAPLKVTPLVLGYVVSEKVKEPKLTAAKMRERLRQRYEVDLSERMIQHLWLQHGVSKKTHPHPSRPGESI